MSYPKPLSEKSLEKMYMESGLTKESLSFLHKFFSSCANLYGAVPLRHVWQIYGELKAAPKLRRKDLLAFSSIVRREEQPYYVFEAQEIFDDDSRSELDRFIVSKELVGVGYGKYGLLYELTDQIDFDRPYCIPEDFLSYAEQLPSILEESLLSFLSGLTSTADECAPKYGRSAPNDHKGQKLGDFSFLNSDERFEVEWQKRPAAREAVLQDYSGTEAEKILRFFKRDESIGRNSPAVTLQWILDELNEVGVEITQEQVETLLRLITDYHNNSRLWCLSGWKPSELATMYQGRGLTAISFGPGMQRAFADGSLDKEALVRKNREMGLKVSKRQMIQRQQFS